MLAHDNPYVSRRQLRREKIRDNRTASQRIRAARRAQQLAEYETNGYPLALVRMLNANPEMTLDDALDGYSVRAQKVA